MTVTVKTALGSHCVGRWEPNSRGRLQEAALTLFAERGFDQTTAAQIAEAAGLTERTFFRHFADKREVLFGGSDLLGNQVVAAVKAAPPHDSPLDAVARGLDAAAAMLGQGRRDLARRRHSVIIGNPELREREFAKLADYSSAIAAVLRDRGVGEPHATMAADAGTTILRVALQRWSNDRDDGPDLSAVLHDALAQWRAMAATGAL
ncbi:MAG TPA: TetR family transcriptional regulator [Acidimicrobiales bacterium]|nr:TetR family transcriptional regulator [Acidimicrobiales bacterium]